MNTYHLQPTLLFIFRDETSDTLLGYLMYCFRLGLVEWQRPEKKEGKTDRKIVISSCSSAQKKDVQDCEVQLQPKGTQAFSKFLP